MPETIRRRPTEDADSSAPELIAERVQAARTGLARLLREADDARRKRAEAATDDVAGAVCAWNHFENIPTFYNWNNRPR